MRETILLHEGWLYSADTPAIHPEEPRTHVMYLQAKTECRIYGPASRDYQEGDGWQEVTLPHDYIISQDLQEGTPWAEGHFRYHNAWYRRRFTLSAEEEGRRIALYFEGVATHAEVYVNGCLAGRNFCGYTPFELDITSFVRFGEENVLAVFVDSTSSFEGWWYQGGGIYRDVWLMKGDMAHIRRDGVYIHPEYEGDGQWRVPLDVEVRNDGVRARNIRVECRGLDPEGREVFLLSQEAELPVFDTVTLRLSTALREPRRWDVEAPVLYSVETRLLEGDELLDSQRDTYGYRTFRFTTEGFYLNDRPLKLKGMCGHQDYGLTGKVMPPCVAEYRAKLYKEMGVNAVRCSHYPHTHWLMDTYDRMGFVVMAETRWFSDEPEAMRQLETLIRLERNRPSVILWSVGNEEPTHALPQGARIVQRMFARVRQLDGTRPLTTVVCHDPVNATVQPYCDVLSINYNQDIYDELHAKYPDKPVVAGETCATATTRGWYADNMPERGFYSAYDTDAMALGNMARETTWKFMMARPWVNGVFQWDAVEHRGEGRWPRLCSVSGAIDLFLQRKDAFWQNQSHYVKEPMIHLLPHWNHPGAEGRPFRVWAYTNCDEAELFLNGVSLGRQKLAAYDHGAWQVPYVPGTLRAVGYRDGKLAAEDVRATTGPACRLKLTVDAADDTADGRGMAILTCVCLDSEGREVPDAEPMLHFDVNVLGTLVGTGSSGCDPISVACPDRRMRAGRAAVCVRYGKAAGMLTVNVRADELAAGYADIALRPAAE